MQTGRMKGQAFIGLPSEKIAAKALRDTNGYLLQDRPMVVVSVTIIHWIMTTCFVPLEAIWEIY